MLQTACLRAAVCARLPQQLSWATSPARSLCLYSSTNNLLRSLNVRAQTWRKSRHSCVKADSSQLQKGLPACGRAMSSANNQHDVSVVYVTVPPAGEEDVAKRIASSVIENKLAACVNIVPGVTSVYWWEGKVEESKEQLLIMKTQTQLVKALTKHVQVNHPYDECEVISMPVTGGSSSYMTWVRNSTQEALK